MPTSSILEGTSGSWSQAIRLLRSTIAESVDTKLRLSSGKRHMSLPYCVPFCMRTTLLTAWQGTVNSIPSRR